MKTQIVAILATSLLAAAACDKPAEPEAQPANTEATEVAEPAAAVAEAKPEEAPAAEEATVATIGKPAPDFELPDETGKKYKLSDLKGSIVVMEWTNPECPVVQRVYSTSVMQAAVKTATATTAGKADAPKIVWLAVDSSNFVKPEDSTKWKTANEVGYPQLQDPSGAVGRMYGAKTTPHMFVVDTEGTLRYSGAIDNNPHGKIEGEDVKNYVTTAISSIIAGEEVAEPETKPYGCSVKYGS